MGPGFGGGGRGGMSLRNEEIEKRTLRDLDPKLFRRFWGIFVTPYVPTLILAILAMLAGTVTGLIGPMLQKTAIDEGMTNGNVDVIMRIALIYVVTHTLSWLFSYSRTFLMSRVGLSLTYDVREHLFKHIQTLSLSFFDRLQAGRIMSRLTSDVEALSQLINSGLMNTINDIFTLIGIVAIMIHNSPLLSLITFFTIPVMALVTTFFASRMRSAYHQVRAASADVNANLQETISGMRVTQSFTREERNLERFNELNEGNFRANIRAASLSSMFFPAIELISSIGTCIVLISGGYLVTTDAVSIGTVVLFLSFITRFFGPIRELTQVMTTIQAAGISLERIFGFLDEVPEVPDLPEATELPAIHGDVRYDHVNFSYEKSGAQILFDIDFEVKRGQTVAFVGATGAGKSSIINLLSRFYDPDNGQITIDGYDIRFVTQHSLRSQIGIVLQDTFIFSGTVMDNIRYGKLNASDEEVIAAAEAVGAHHFIMRLADGYQTEVNERGSKLSVGQRQLLAFARALLANPQLLILDEATSSVDAYTETLIQQALDRLLTERTAFVIAHRLSTIRNADCIYALDQGRIVEAGTHDELLERGGLYARLYEMQFKDQEASAS